VLLPRQRFKLARGTKDKEHAMSQKLNTAIAVIGIDIGKNSFHVVGHDERGAIVLRQKWSRGQVEARFTNMPPCLIGMEACVGAHHLSRRLKALSQADIRASLVRGLTAADQSEDSAARLTMRRIGPDQPHQMQGEEVGIL
jgi:transposase